MGWEHRGKLKEAAAREGVTVQEMIGKRRAAGKTYFQIAVELGVYPRAVEWWAKKGAENVIPKATTK